VVWNTVIWNCSMCIQLGLLVFPGDENNVEVTAPVLAMYILRP
jgi:hypothetical protein